MIAKVFEVEKDEYTNDGKLKTKKINERIFSTGICDRRFRNQSPRHLQ